MSYFSELDAIEVAAYTEVGCLPRICSPSRRPDLPTLPQVDTSLTDHYARKSMLQLTREMGHFEYDRESLLANLDLRWNSTIPTV
jgi:hypothetical protein